MRDCVVVGGRVAGAALAIHLARRSRSVLVLERERQPAPTLSTNLFGDWDAFDPLGVTDRVLAAGAPPITRFRTDLEGSVLEGDLLVTPHVLGLRRERLDAILMERAVAFDTVEWREGWSVTGLLGSRDRVVGVRARAEDGRAVEERARVVVGADGRHSSIARAAGARAYLSRPRTRCAYYTYLEGVLPTAVPTVEYYWWGSDVVLVIPADAGLHCICVMPPQRDFPRWRTAPQESFDARVRTIRTLWPRLRGARQVGRVRGSGSLGSYLRTPWGDGWALVGDAGAAVHPCIGAGIDHAVVSAGLLADALDAYLTGGRGWDDAMTAYQTGRDMRVEPVLEAALALARREPLADSEALWLRLLVTLPGLAHDLGSQVTDVLARMVGPRGLERLRALADLPAPEASEAAPTAGTTGARGAAR